MNQEFISVGNLPPGVAEDSLQAAFSRFGEINQILIAPGAKSETPTARKTALIEFKDIRHAEKAVNDMNGCFFFGLRLDVKWANQGQKRAKSDMVVNENTSLPQQGLVA